VLGEVLIKEPKRKTDLSGPFFEAYINKREIKQQEKK
jgi:hypothetical protein